MSDATIETFTASDGYPLRYRHYAPSGTLRGRVVCLHGIQSHGGWYEYSCRRLADAGYNVSFLDRRGSGLNHAARGDAPSFRRLIDDVADFARTLRGPGRRRCTRWAAKASSASTWRTLRRRLRAARTWTWSACS